MEFLPCVCTLVLRAVTSLSPLVIFMGIYIILMFAVWCKHFTFQLIHPFTNQLQQHINIVLDTLQKRNFLLGRRCTLHGKCKEKQTNFHFHYIIHKRKRTTKDNCVFNCVIQSISFNYGMGGDLLKNMGASLAILRKICLCLKSDCVVFPVLWDRLFLQDMQNETVISV